MCDDLSLCMLGNFSCFYCRLLTFFKINFFQKNSFRGNLDLDREIWVNLFSKVISRRQNSQLAMNELVEYMNFVPKNFRDHE